MENLEKDFIRSLRFLPKKIEFDCGISPFNKYNSKPLEKEEDKMICSEFTAWTEEWMRPETFTPDKVEKYCRRSYRYKLIQIK